MLTDLATGETLLMRLSLSVVSGGSRGKSVSLGNGTLVVGGAPDVDFPIEDGRASRRHASFELVPDGVRIKDLKSKNGTIVNGARISEAIARPGAVIELGDTTIVVVGEGQPIAASRATLGGVPAHGAAMQRLFSILARASASEVTILLQGESGVGKDVVARAVHAESARKQRPLVVVDCGAIAPGLIASELFGHRRGAFTSASEDRVGAFEAAKGGTLFLDEIGELPLDLQPTLLRVLETRHVTRVGETQSRAVDVRVIAATNRNLKQEVDRGRFRADLFFRLAVVSITIPPLRDRREEVLALAERFLKENGRRLDEIAPADRQRLLEHRWPGNVRELRNVIARSCALADPSGRVALLFDDDNSRPTSSSDFSRELLELPLPQARAALLEKFDERYLRAVLEETGGNVSAAARRAGVARSYFHRLLQRHPDVRHDR